MKTMAVLLLLSAAAVAQSQPDLATTIDFMNEMVKPDGRQLALVSDSKCEVVITSMHRANMWMLSFSENVWKLFNDSDAHGDNIPFPRYTKFNLADIDPATIDSKVSGFSDTYLERFWDEHPTCKVVGRCKDQEMIDFDLDRSDITAVAFKTVDLKRVVERGGTTKIERPEGVQYHFDLNVSVEKMGILFTDKDRAQRFVTAFVHGVNLCGGYNSTFAPTPSKN